LSLRLGASPDRQDGITANLDYYFPEELARTVDKLVCQQFGRQYVSWTKESIALRLFGSRQVNDFNHAKAISEKIDAYIRWRPEELEEGFGDLQELKRLYDSLSAYGTLPIEQRRFVLEKLRGERIDGLPKALLFAGVSNLPGGREYGQLLEALSHSLDVYIFEPLGVVSEQKDEVHVADWLSESRDARTLFSELANATGGSASQAEIATKSDNLLGKLQDSIRAGTLVEAGPVDNSVQLIGAYGDSRQVENLRDAILQLLGDKSLEIEPHEVLVVSPAVDSFGPLIERHWLYEKREAGQPRLPFDYFERPVGSASNRLDASVELLHLLGTRATIGQLSNFCAIPAVAHALDLHAHDQDRLWELARDGKVMLGTSAAQRERFRLIPRNSDSMSAADLGTWERFVDSAALHYFLPESISTIDSVAKDSSAASQKAPLSPIGVFEDLDLLGRLAPLLQFLDRESVQRSETTKNSLQGWLDLLNEWVGLLLPATVEDRSFERELANLRQLALDVSEEVLLTLVEFQNIWVGRSQESTRPTVFGRGGVLVGGLTGLMHARFKVVAILGFDEEKLPGVDYSQILAKPPRIGEPNSRRSILNALATAVLSADTHLIVTFNAHNEESGRREDPSIPLTELIDTANSLVEGEVRVERFTSRHEFYLGPEADSGQTFDPRVELITVAPNSQSAQDLIPSFELLNPQRADERTATLHEFVDFMSDPARFFLRSVVGAEIPYGWPEVASGVEFAWDKRSTERIVRGLVRKVRQYVAEHPEIVTFAHLYSDAEAVRQHSIPRDNSIYDLFLEFFEKEVDEIAADPAIVGAVPRGIWEGSLKRDEIALEAFLLENEYEEHEEVETIFRDDLTITYFEGDFVNGTELPPAKSYELDLSSERGTRDAATFHFFRSLAESERTDEPEALKLMSELRPSEGAQEGIGNLKMMIGLLLAKVAYKGEVTGELLYRGEKIGPYTRKQDQRQKGEFPNLAKRVYRFSGSVAEAQQILGEMFELFASVWRGPVPFFPRLDLKASADGLQLKWDGDQYTFGQSEYEQNRILWPMNYIDLLDLDVFTRNRVYSGLLSSWRNHFAIDNITQSKGELPIRTRKVLGEKE
jgi:hypothetical protein